MEDESKIPSKKQLLIVSRDQSLCQPLAKEFQRNFFQPILSDNVKQALELLHTNQVDILLLDLNLPDVNGLALLKQIKSRPPATEIIFITDDSTHHIAVEALRRGAIDYIQKPLDLEQVNATIGRTLEKIEQNKKLTHKNTVLVIDDDADTIARLRKLLAKENYTTFGATSGQAGIETIQQNRIDLVITDIRMGGMGGIEVLENVKKLYRHIEVIMVTGYGEQELAVRALKAGAIDYLQKPINLDELLYSIEKTMERINLYQTRLYRNRELKITSEVMTRMNEELEKLLAERTAKLSQTQFQLVQSGKMAAIGNLAAGIAHEINNPLTAITMNTAFLLDLAKTDERLIKKLKVIEKESDRATEIIKGLLTFARKGKQTEKKPTDIHQIIEDTLKPVERQLSLSNIKVIREFSPNLPPVLVNANQIQQVFLNLITNARDAMDREGESVQKKLLIKTYSKPWMVVEFSDTGRGISPAELDKIFDPFYTTKSPGKGTGLGLAISYEIIKDLKGDIEVKSEIGKGTTFRVILPVGQTG